LIIRFVVFGDTKGKENGLNKGVLKKLMMQIKKLDLKPNFFAVLGDTIAGSDNLDIHKKQMEGFKDFIKAYFPGIIVLPVIGNHEVNNEPKDDCYEKMFKDIYINFKQHGKLISYNNTSYYMDLEYCRFIFLNCYHKNEIRKITNEQLEWFKKISKSDKKFNIVFMHCPLFPTGAHLGTCMDEFEVQRDELAKIINDNKIDIIFAGHEHNYSRRIIGESSNNTYQVVSGGGGEKLRDSFKSKKGVVVAPKAIYHFVVVDMDSDSIKIKAVSVEGKIIDEFKIIK
jgi:hypothetical protein